MTPASWSERYALGAALLLLAVVLLNNALLMLLAAIVGLAAGAWVAWQGEVRRAAMVAMAGFAAVLVFAVFTLLR